VTFTAENSALFWLAESHRRHDNSTQSPACYLFTGIIPAVMQSERKDLTCPLSGHERLKSRVDCTWVLLPSSNYYRRRFELRHRQRVLASFVLISRVLTKPSAIPRMCHMPAPLYLHWTA
jgi:hypothetical protein